MKVIDIFYQGEGLREIQHLEIDSVKSYRELKELIVGKHGVDQEVILFMEDEDDPVDNSDTIKKHPHHNCAKIHLHRCRQIEVTVTFNGEKLLHRFSPSITIARVKQWATTKLGMSNVEASEHVLQISGTQNRPTAGTHIGSLTAKPCCQLSFDLVPDQRINGFAEGVSK